MYTLKSIARRGMSLGMAVALFAATVVPSASVFADDLNPLTDRSLTLSSGSPGWAFTDGSGNSTYAPPNSGANGQKTGNTFGFKVSSTAEVKGLSFQYCTTSAGNCTGPGDNLCASGTTGGGDCVRKTNQEALDDGDKTSDLSIVAPSASSATFATHLTDDDAATNPNGVVSSVPDPSTAGTNFLMYYNEGGTWTQVPGTWAMAASAKQDGTVGSGTATGKNNYITLTSATGHTFDAGEDIRIVFFGKDANYITNPGSKEFFVKINTWDTDTTTDFVPLNEHNIDGGVTVANVMNQSIQITTKVLETMDFSVGTVDPYTLAATGSTGSQLHAANGDTLHAVCAPILKGMTPSDAVNTLKMGNETGEFSLETDATYSTHSYWRLSSNSSAGATVYYSGVTLSNTVGDKIDPIYNATPGDGLARAPQEGMEQFGLALANGSRAANPQPADPVAGTNVHAVNYVSERTGGDVFEWGADNAANGLATPASGAIDASVTDNGISNLDANPSWHAPRLWPLIPGAQYDRGAGIVNTEYTVPGGAPEDDTINTAFAFDETSNTIPVPIATQDQQVVDCVTGKMRYIANIAATTPAGIYTTKINYIAAPQY
jgi:hypothetical protein